MDFPFNKERDFEEIWKNKNRKYRFFHKISENFSGLRTPGIYYVDTVKFLCNKRYIFFTI